MGNVLVVFFSRSGNTQMLALELARAGDWDCEAIRDRTRRGGVLGWLRSGYEATLARPVAIAPLGHDLAAYDVVVVGSPVWNSSVSSPVRAFLRQHRGELPRVAFFVTCGGRGGRRALAQMAKLARQAPLATLIATERELDAGPFASVEGFVRAVAHALRPAAPAAPRPDRTTSSAPPPA